MEQRAIDRVTGGVAYVLYVWIDRDGVERREVEGPSMHVSCTPGGRPRKPTKP